MYTFLRTLTPSQLAMEHFPTFAAAFLIAEFFYKFKSFALEAAAFLITWYVLDAARVWITSFLRGSDEPHSRK